jgi:nicotinate-nucleotide adenylyltransferase
MGAAGKRPSQNLISKQIMKRVGIFGGSFSPVHYGHLLAAAAAKEQLRLHEVLFVPCAESADQKKLLPASVRLAMLRAAIKGSSGYRVSEIELKRGGVSRSIETVQALMEGASRTDKFFLLIGADQALSFGSWKEPKKLSKLAKVVFFRRPGFTENPYNLKRFKFKIIPISPFEISSTVLRTADLLDIRTFMPLGALRIFKRYRKE